MIGQTRVIAALALGFFAWSVSADAQQPTKVPRVGILSDESLLLAVETLEPFAQQHLVAESLRARGGERQQA